MFEGTADEIAAATKIQAMERGRLARKEDAAGDGEAAEEAAVESVADDYGFNGTEDEQVAATKLQAMQRGKAARKDMGGGVAAADGAEAESEPAAEAEPELAVARSLEADAVTEDAVAEVTVADVMEMEGVDEAEAAVQIQARYRGNQQRAGKTALPPPADAVAEAMDGAEPTVADVMEMEGVDEAEAAVRIQARYRGNQQRAGKTAPIVDDTVADEVVESVADVMEMEGVDEAEAAMRIQARYRGNQARQALGPSEVAEESTAAMAGDDSLDPLQLPEDSSANAVDDELDNIQASTADMEEAPPWPAGRSPPPGPRAPPTLLPEDTEDPSTRSRKDSKVQFVVDGAGDDADQDAALDLDGGGAAAWFSGEPAQPAETVPVVPAPPVRLVPTPPSVSPDDGSGGQARHKRRHMPGATPPVGAGAAEKYGRPDDVSVEESIERLANSGAAGVAAADQTGIAAPPQQAGATATATAAAPTAVAAPAAAAAGAAGSSAGGGDPFMAAMESKLAAVQSDVARLQAKIIERTVASQQLCHEVAAGGRRQCRGGDGRCGRAGQSRPERADHGRGQGARGAEPADGAADCAGDRVPEGHAPAAQADQDQGGDRLGLGRWPPAARQGRRGRGE
eukprot:SAG22_NODE_1517_length_4241_cov_6.138098_1_plen_625_part_00